MVKKKNSWLQMPKLHSKYSDKTLEDALIEKANEFLSEGGEETPSFIFLSGQFFDVKNIINKIIFA